MVSGTARLYGWIGQWLPCALLALASLAGAAAVSARQAGPGPVAVVFPPWWSGAQALLAASAIGTPVRFGAAGFVVVLVPDVSDPSSRLRQAGAWLIMDPLSLGGCEAT